MKAPSVVRDKQNWLHHVASGNGARLVNEYSKFEHVRSLDEFEHPVVREVFKIMDINCAGLRSTARPTFRRHVCFHDSVATCAACRDLVSHRAIAPAEHRITVLLRMDGK